MTFFTTAANSTAASGTYADGGGYITALRGTMAAMSSATLFDADVVIPAGKEYNAAAAANDSAGRPLLVYGPAFNAPGTSGAGYEALAVQGVPLLPGPFMLANKSLLIDQEVAAAAVFATPVMNFRLEWTTDATSGGNVKLLKLAKYSGVGFWTQYKGGVVCLTNTTPLALDAGGFSFDADPTDDEKALEPAGRKGREVTAPPAGWPTLADLERKLGLKAGDDTQLAQEALDAAIADAVHHLELAGPDDPTLALDWGQWDAVRDLGVLRYQDRNRSPDYMQQGPFALNSPTRTRVIQQLLRGKVAIA